MPKTPSLPRKCFTQSLSPRKSASLGWRRLPGCVCTTPTMVRRRSDCRTIRLPKAWALVLNCTCATLASRSAPAGRVAKTSTSLTSRSPKRIQPVSSSPRASFRWAANSSNRVRATPSVKTIRWSVWYLETEDGGLRMEDLLGPRLCLGPHYILGPRLCLGPHYILGPRLCLGPHYILGPRLCLGPHYILGPRLCLGPHCREALLRLLLGLQLK